MKPKIEIPEGAELCEDCNGHGVAVYSCCTQEIVDDDFMMCPKCHEHLGEEECWSCEGKGFVFAEPQIVQP